MRTAVLVTAATVAIGLAIAGEADAATSDGESSAAGSGPEGGSTLGLEEIVVTAQKRSERLQDVPISISVLSGDDLDKFTGLTVNEALTAVPGLTINQGGLLANATVLNMRGVSAADETFAGSSPVAYYVDSVPFGMQRQAIVPDPNAYDLKQIEVLRGPQGTLYGASALNGVVRVLTRDADLNNFEAKTRASLATLDEGGDIYRGDLAVNVPIVTGKLAARVVLGYADDGGWIDRLNKDDANSGHQSNARLKVNAQLTEQFSMSLSAWLSRSKYNASTLSGKDYLYDGVLDQPQTSDFNAFGIKVGYELPGVSVSSMSSYVDYTSENLLDATPFGGGFIGTSYFTALDSRIFSQEILLASTDEATWRWSLGGFYRDAKDRINQHGVFLLAPNGNADLSESTAVFGELTRLFWDGKVELTGGLRYFKDRVEMQELVPHSGVPGSPLIFNEDTFTDVSPRVVLSCHPSDDLTLYGSYSKGFRSGISQGPAVLEAAPGYPPAQEDSLENYEVGVKGDLASGRFGYDAAVYYIDWQDVQQVVTVPIGPGFHATYVNGVSASGVGIDLALLTRFAGLELSTSVSWNDLGFDEASFNPVTGVLLFGEGDRLGLSSEYTARASLSYVFPLGGLEGRFSAGVNYQSRQSTRTAAATTTTTMGDDIVIGRADFSFGLPDRWRAMLFVENLTNEQRVVQLDSFSPSWATYTRPRSIGLQLEYTF